MGGFDEIRTAQDAARFVDQRMRDPKVKVVTTKRESAFRDDDLHWVSSAALRTLMLDLALIGQLSSRQSVISSIQHMIDELTEIKGRLEQDN